MTWPQDAYVGQKVVCIFFDAEKTQDSMCRKYPIVKDEVYTILDITIHKDKLFFKVQDNLSVLRLWWLAYQFRPVQSTKTGMKILTEILLTQKVKEDV